jgi:hypothetical protein
MANKDIIQELSDLGSNLPGNISQNIYSVPPGYFDGFAEQILSLIRSNEDLSWISSLPKENLYKVPSGYFDGLDERIMETIRKHPDYQTSKEELESVSPLLNSINKRPVYSVPEGYFENFKFKDSKRKNKSRIVSIKARMFRYAAAAIIVGVILTIGLISYKNNRNDPAGKTLAKFEKEVKKIDDVKSTETLIDFMDAGMNEKELASNQKVIKTDDVQQLLKDVSNDELKDFSDESKDIEDVMMAN